MCACFMYLQHVKRFCDFQILLKSYSIAKCSQKNADSVKCKYRVNCFKQKNVKCQNEFFEKIHNRVCRCACDEFLIPINVFIGKSILSMSKQFVNTFYLLNKTMRRSEPQFAKFESQISNKKNLPPSQIVQPWTKKNVSTNEMNAYERA